MIFNLSDQHSVGNRFVAELRDVVIQKDRMRFRRNLERLGEILAYEVSKTMEYEVVEVETSLGIAKATLPIQDPVLATILRAGLPLHQGLLNFFDNSPSSFISAFRMHHKDGSFEIKLESVSCPSLEGRTLVLSDPMLASGASMCKAINALLEHGTPSQIHLVTGIASTYGINYVRRMFPNAYIWMGAQDEELTAKSYIVPGLGDAGDLCFGEKVQD